jgi:hypothetical protein
MKKDMKKEQSLATTNIGTTSRPNPSQRHTLEYIVTPLNSTFMLTSILGFLTSVFYLPTLDSPTIVPYSIAFSIVFLCMFVASLITMSVGESDEALQIDEKRRVRPVVNP